MRKEKRWKKKKKKDKKKNVEHGRTSGWRKFHERIVLILTERMKGEEKARKKLKKKRPRTKQVLGESGRLLFFLMFVARNWLCVNAAAEGLHRRTEMTERMRQNQEVQVKERQMDGGDSTKVETAKRSRQD